MSSFAEATGKATGQTPRNVRRGVRRGKQARDTGGGDWLRDIIGTALDKDVEIDALLDASQQIGESYRAIREVIAEKQNPPS